MKNKKTLYEIVYFSTLNVLHWCGGMFGLNRLQDTDLILCYHSVGDNDWRFNVTKEELERQIKYLKSHFEVVPLSTLMEKESSSNRVSITFDDGYKNVIQEVLPMFKKHGIVATVFVIGDAGLADREELDNSIELLSDRDVKKLYDEGWEIGFHTKAHRDLRKLSKLELQEEIIEGKREFESRLGIKTSYFAYPRGTYSDEIISLVRKSKFTHAFTVDSVRVNNRDVMKIGRISIEKELTLRQFQSLLTPMGVKISSILLNMLKIKESLRYNLSKTGIL